MLLLFKDPNNILEGECKSKLLDPNSELYKWIQQFRQKLAEHGIIFDAREPHVELFSHQEYMTERINRVTQRAVQLHGSEISMDLHIMAGKALVLSTDFVEKYGVTHLTIAYFKEGLIDSQLEDLNNLDFEHFKKYRISARIYELTETTGCVENAILKYLVQNHNVKMRITTRSNDTLKV